MSGFMSGTAHLDHSCEEQTYSEKKNNVLAQ